MGQELRVHPERTKKEMHKKMWHKHSQIEVKRYRKDMHIRASSMCLYLFSVFLRLMTACVMFLHSFECSE